ncbi:hypothetical protein OP10G_0714 [Fimbriimonas ginsengisoli Gsoil 348]|uniref:Uncharacterized protein n=1 Tax=Fimbriimonas ginsengisoli Gsoil 348 TaxID=661478 RepID=A0A068NL01_FIMGI|nr:hypothetical protein OP10G_0714 [Fimbriimonas ginsengisoli Gsoil 348]
MPERHAAPLERPRKGFSGDGRRRDLVDRRIGQREDEAAAGLPADAQHDVRPTERRRRLCGGDWNWSAPNRDLAYRGLVSGSPHSLGIGIFHPDLQGTRCRCFVKN